MSAVWVVKLGSSLLTANGEALDRRWIAQVAAQVAALRAQGVAVVLVSSGAVAAGLARLGRAERPTELAQLQAVAAIGQPDVMQAWSVALAEHGLVAAQLLLSHEEARSRERYLNVRATLRELLAQGVVPVVNENDSVATEEIRFGDNDRLAAMVADLAAAERLLLLTDQWGLATADPRREPGARRISSASAADPALDAMAGGGGSLGRGGMLTKLAAARRAARSGITTWILYGRLPGVLLAAAAGQAPGTCLRPADKQRRWRARQRWLGTALHVQGAYHLDAGAARALRAGRVSLLPVGVTAVDGDFRRGDLVACLDAQGREVARGLSNYSAADAARLCGAQGREVAQRLGRPGEAECIHRDNLVLSEDGA